MRAATERLSRPSNAPGAGTYGAKNTKCTRVTVGSFASPLSSSVSVVASAHNFKRNVNTACRPVVDAPSRNTSSARAIALSNATTPSSARSTCTTVIPRPTPAPSSPADASSNKSTAPPPARSLVDHPTHVALTSHFPRSIPSHDSTIASTTIATAPISRTARAASASSSPAPRAKIVAQSSPRSIPRFAAAAIVRASPSPVDASSTIVRASRAPRRPTRAISARARSKSRVATVDVSRAFESSSRRVVVSTQRYRTSSASSIDDDVIARARDLARLRRPRAVVWRARRRVRRRAVVVRVVHSLTRRNDPCGDSNRHRDSTAIAIAFDATRHDDARHVARDAKDARTDAQVDVRQLPTHGGG